MLQLATCVAVNVAEDKYPDGQALVREGDDSGDVRD